MGVIDMGRNRMLYNQEKWVALTCLVTLSLIQILGPENDDAQFLVELVITQREENHSTVLTETLWGRSGWKP